MTGGEFQPVPGRMRTYQGEDRARHARPGPPLDGTEKAAQAYVDRITRSAWWSRHCKPSWLGDQTHSHGWTFDTSQPPRRILVQQARGFRAVAYSESVTKHRGRWMPRIRLGTATDKDWPTASIADPYVILHEVAHIMVGCDEDCGDTGHGRWFRYYHVILVARWMGPEYAAALKAGYEAERLKWRRPKRA